MTPTGTFTVSSPYTWNLTNLYTTGEVTLVAAPGLPGDYNGDGTVDAADYVVWRKTGGTQEGYNIWRTNFGLTVGGAAQGATGYASAQSLSAAVPEPTALALIAFGLLGIIVRVRRSLPTMKNLTRRRQGAEEIASAVLLCSLSASA